MSAPYAEVIGDPIAQSKSPLIHGFWLERSGIEGDYRRQHVTADALPQYLAERRGDPDWRGCNVTMPHKQAVLPLLDRLDPVAEKVGAVNTIVRDHAGVLTGHNTDVGGFLEPIRDILAERHLFRMARVIGTGGAARAVIAGLAGQGFTLVLAGRDPAKAQRLLDELGGDGEHFTPPLAHFAEPTDFAFDDREQCLDLVVNASPLGMAGQPPLAFAISHAPPGSVVYDIVTDPVDTVLLQQARAAGFRTIDGFAMLIGQAAQAFTLFFGAEPPRRDDAKLRALLLDAPPSDPMEQAMTPPRIIGLTGSIGMGKSTVADMFERASVPVFDADAEVRAMQGPGGELLPAIEAAFPGSTGADGVIREALGARVFGDAGQLARLEAIVHPAVAARRVAFLDRHRGSAMVVFDIPLLFEKGGHGSVDTVIVVSAPPDIQRARVLARPGMTPEKFENILALQVPDADKRARADHVIDTGRSLEETEAAVHALIDQLRDQAPPGTDTPLAPRAT